MSYEVVTFQDIRLLGAWVRQVQGMSDTMISYTAAGTSARLVIDYQKARSVPQDRVVLISVTENVAHIDYGPLSIPAPTTFPFPLKAPKKRRREQS